MADNNNNKQKAQAQAQARKLADDASDATYAAAGKAQKFFYQGNETMEKAMTQGKAHFEKLSQDAASAGREQMDAFMKSGNVFARGFEDLLKTYSALAQSAAERNAQAFKALIGSKTLNEFTETQNRVAQESFDDFLSGVTKISELSVRVATETLEPINDQIGKSIKKASESMAA